MMGPISESYGEILRERRRQVSSEGYSSAHDDALDDGELLRAGVIYLHHGTSSAARPREDGAPMGWPWPASAFRPGSRRRNLVRAGALFVAERDRSERLGLSTGPARHKIAIAIRELDALPPET